MWQTNIKTKLYYCSPKVLQCPFRPEQFHFIQTDIAENYLLLLIFNTTNLNNKRDCYENNNNNNVNRIQRVFLFFSSKSIVNPYTRFSQSLRAENKLSSSLFFFMYRNSIEKSISKINTFDKETSFISLSNQTHNYQFQKLNH